MATSSPPLPTVSRTRLSHVRCVRMEKRRGRKTKIGRPGSVKKLGIVNRKERKEHKDSDALVSVIFAIFAVKLFFEFLAQNFRLKNSS